MHKQILEKGHTRNNKRNQPMERKRKVFLINTNTKGARRFSFGIVLVDCHSNYRALIVIGICCVEVF